MYKQLFLFQTEEEEEEEERHLLYTKKKNQRQKVERIQRDVMDMIQRLNPFTPKKIERKNGKMKERQGGIDSC